MASGTDGSSSCVFCSLDGQPRVLVEDASLFAMPDKYPLVPGHTLIISKEHLACYAEARDTVLQQLERLKSRLLPFLRDSYQDHVLVWENGIAGQSIPHAHLHLVPFSRAELPPHIVRQPDVRSARGWDDVRTHFHRHGVYRYAEINGRRWIICGHSPLLEEMYDWIAGVSGGYRRDGHFVRRTTEADVAALEARWDSWLDAAGPVTAHQP